MAASPVDRRHAQPYPSDVTDEQWEIIAPFLMTTSESGPGSRGGRPLDYHRRDVWDAITYQNRTGCQWRYLPHDFPPHDTVYRYFSLWTGDGTIEAVHDALHEMVRQNTPLPENPEDPGNPEDPDNLDPDITRRPHAPDTETADGPHDPDPAAADAADADGRGGGGGRMRSALASAGVLDSQSIAAAPTVARATAEQIDSATAVTTNRPDAVADSRGYDAGKHINGRKRHVLVDTCGLVIAVVVTAASVSDNAGGIAVLTKAVTKEAGTDLRKVWVDGGYKKAFAEAAHNLGVDVDVVAKPAGQKGFTVLPRRWVVERTHAWIYACRRLARDYERRHIHAEAQFHLASIAIMLRRLAPTPGRTPWSPPVTA